MKSLVLIHEGQIIDPVDGPHGHADTPRGQLRLEVGGPRGGTLVIETNDGAIQLGRGADCARVLGGPVTPRNPKALCADTAIMVGRGPVLVAEACSLRSKNHGGETISWVTWNGMIGSDPAMLRAWSNLARAADGDAPVWILGESGTGKERAARTVHDFSPRRNGPFIAINCAALPENLIESELFGVARGAFTGADRDRPGAFQRADGGTLFLDEVGELSPATQARLLRAIESGEVARVGASRAERVDVRIVTATWRDLEQEVSAGRFRHDLLHRLWVLRVDLPSLRSRQQDVVAITAWRLLNRGALHLLPGARMRQVMAQHAWTGNVRQLLNQIERAIVHDDARHLLPETQGVPAGGLLPRRSNASVLTSEIAERHHIVQRIKFEIKKSKGNRSRAAMALGVSRSTLYRWLRDAGSA